MKNKNSSVPLRIKIVIALFFLSIIGLVFNISAVLNMGQDVGGIVMHDLLIVLIYVLIIYGLVLMKKWGYYLALLDSLATLGTMAFAAPEFFAVINSMSEVQSGEVGFGNFAVVGLIPVIIMLYIFYAVISERNKFKD